MTSSTAVTLTADQWDIVSRHVRSTASRYNEEAQAPGMPIAAKQALVICAKIAREYSLAIGDACDAVPGDGDVTVTLDHPGTEIARGLTDVIMPNHDLTTWAGILAYGRSEGTFCGWMTVDEMGGAEPSPERLAALSAEAIARRDRWSVIARPIVSALWATSRGVNL
ncbi:hypothetical protein ACQVP2_22200 [Methylobacterium aquaticum]|uniref:hypothetical protein n=1 Tax=Methylobacterium aquaticum TaxID=270351 RepID=UPI003D1683D4